MAHKFLFDENCFCLVNVDHIESFKLRYVVSEWVITAITTGNVYVMRRYLDELEARTDFQAIKGELLNVPE